RQFPLGYWAPEVFREENEDEKSLVYTLGAFLVHLISGRWPFHQYNYPQLLWNVGSGRLLLYPPSNSPPLLSSIIIDCCRFNKEKRPSFRGSK
ncbi:hypothetical protein PENTCL1PPCAC_7288, partial [Pristionchus entomophagus]